MSGYEIDSNVQFQSQCMIMLCIVRKVQPSMAECVPYTGPQYPPHKNLVPPRALGAERDKSPIPISLDIFVACQESTLHWKAQARYAALPKGQFRRGHCIVEGRRVTNTTNTWISLNIRFLKRRWESRQTEIEIEALKRCAQKMDFFFYLLRKRR